MRAFFLAALISTPAYAAPSYFSIQDAKADEGVGQIQFGIRRSGIASTASIRVATRTGTATAPGDFTSLSQLLTFAPGEAFKLVVVTLNNDTIKEGTENFTLKVSPVSNARLWDDGSATGVVTDLSDTASAPAATVTPNPSLSVDDITVQEGGVATVTIRKHGTLNANPSTFSLYTINGSATSPADYTAQQLQITLAGNENSRTINIPITDDTNPEPVETFTVKISAGANSRLYDGTAIVTITDADQPPPPPPVQTKLCPDGTTVPITATCPPPPTKECPDGTIIPIADTCPVIVTPPPVPTGDILAESLEGYTQRAVPDHDHLTSLTPSWGTGAIAPSAAGSDVVGAYRQVCGVTGATAYNDHIVYPGNPGRSHLHDFNGHERGRNADETFDTLLASGASSCNWQTGGNATKAVQRSSYWIPALLYGSTGQQILRVNHVQLYYKRRPKTDTLCRSVTTGGVGLCTEIPNGLRMVAGSRFVAGQYGPSEGWRTDVPPMDFKCHEGGGTFKTLAGLAASSAAATCKTLQISANMPDCWNGTHLWKTDRTHLAYSSYRGMSYSQCPTSHPYLITGLSIFYVYNVTGLNVSLLQLSSDYMDPTQPKGWSIHADAHIVWDWRVKRMFHDNCIDKLLNCSGGDLGNGLQLKGAAQPSYGWTNPNRLETTPPHPPNMVMPN